MERNGPIKRWIELIPRKVLTLCLALAAGWTALAAELTIAAASDLKFALDEIAADFQSTDPNVKLRIAYGSSGNYYAQILNDAPFDLYFSADLAYPQKLADAGLALDPGVFIYGIGRIVLWVPRGSALDLEQGARALLAVPPNKIAIANPRHAPYGAAAVAALKNLDLYEQLQPSLVLGENVAQTAQFVQSGAAQAGIIALALARSPVMAEAGQWWEFPSETYPRMDQGGMILKRTAHPAAARRFRDYVTGPEGTRVLRKYGLSPPEKPASE